MTGDILLKKNGRGDHLKLKLEEFNGHRLASLRVWFPPAGGGPLRPGREGFAVQATLLPELIAGLRQVEEEARSIGWLPPAGAATCEGCGSQFHPTRADAKCCSAKCRARASRDKRTDPHGAARQPSEAPADTDPAG